MKSDEGLRELVSPVAGAVVMKSRLHLDDSKVIQSSYAMFIFVAYTRDSRKEEVKWS